MHEFIRSAASAGPRCVTMGAQARTTECGPSPSSIRATSEVRGARNQDHRAKPSKTAAKIKAIEDHASSHILGKPRPRRSPNTVSGERSPAQTSADRHRTATSLRSNPRANHAAIRADDVFPARRRHQRGTRAITNSLTAEHSRRTKTTGHVEHSRRTKTAAGTPTERRRTSGSKRGQGIAATQRVRVVPYRSQRVHEHRGCGWGIQREQRTGNERTRARTIREEQ